MNPKKVTVPIIRAMKSSARIGMITAYDYPSARIADSAGADILLVGDSLGMVVLGYPDTLQVTVDDMLHHTRAAARGTQRALLVGDMPYLSYHISIEESVRNAGKFIQAGAHAVKVEGAKPQRIKTIEAMLSAEIPVMGHIGLTPQSVNALGGFKLQGKAADDARRLVDEAVALDQVGCFSIVLEMVPAELAAIITERVSIPTIGIGAGPHCDGQVLVFHDLLGLYDGHTPRFVRKYAQAGDVMRAAIEKYLDDVREGRFPDIDSESFHAASAEELRKLYGDERGGEVVPLTR
jgi:3-methyl-2-oxobutanoate hydroxymethyltransferase